MKTITRDYITNVLAKENPPCDRVRAGEIVAFETYDCFTNQFLPEEATFENVIRKPGNPATGPLYIEGAMPGDMLKIDILDIEMGPVGIVMLGPNSGSEKEEFPQKVLRRVPVKGAEIWTALRSKREPPCICLYLWKGLFCQWEIFMLSWETAKWRTAVWR